MASPGSATTILKYWWAGGPQNRMGIKVNREVTVINKLGLHARASAQLVKLAGTYASDIRLTLGEQSVDGKNIMGLMMLAATYGSRIMVTAEGEDADRAVERIGALFSERFGEPE